MYNNKLVPLQNITIFDNFWKKYIDLVTEKVVYYQWEVLNDRVDNAPKSHCVKNFSIAAGRVQGTFEGMVFQDSDLYKWLESVGYALVHKRDEKLEALADSAVELIGQAQQADGYINTYYTLTGVKRWSNLREGHELYCGGHLIEAAVAYYNATGKDAILKIACRFADCVYNTFGLEPEKSKGYPGHQEIELALFKLYEVTGNAKYLATSEYFIRQRGTSPFYFDMEKQQPEFKEIFPELLEIDKTYNQSHMPPVQQTKACGHAVRAVYMYSAMADIAAERGDIPLANACEVLFNNIAQQQMYITGGIGATAWGESFATDYALPGDAIYGETCASIGLMMFANRMARKNTDAMFADVMEKALYNGVLSGISLAGTEFFYVNPLEVVPDICENTPDLAHVRPVRQKWFKVACCPTNLTRTILSLGQYICSYSPKQLCINLYVGSDIRFETENGKAGATITTEGPWGRKACIELHGGEYTLLARSPANRPIIAVRVDGVLQTFVQHKGYVQVHGNWKGNIVELEFALEPRLVKCNPKAYSNAGKAAVEYGPFVYCMEEVDNGATLATLAVQEHAVFKQAAPVKGLPESAVVLETEGLRTEFPDVLYYAGELQHSPVNIKFIPYHLWANRGRNEMSVYVRMV